MEKQWFAIHTYAGYENKVKENLEKRAESMHMEEYITRVIVPMEEEVQIKDGRKKVIQRKVFPGYVLVEMVMTDHSWYVVRNTSGVTGFVGAGNKAVPLHPHEVEAILSQMGVDESKVKLMYEVGENVRVKEGPFESLVGVVEELFPDKGKLRVSVSMFGRETPVELEFYQVEKI
ncbi:MAG: transcription termination/antitermination protein NusG [Firmicutes bacterium]|nr:transcription termination/antitermination protein NusG [Bacillota bacterium]